MPNSFVIDVRRQLIVVRLWGALTKDVIYAQRQQLLQDAGFDPTYRILVFMDIDQALISGESLGQFARTGIIDNGARRAVVAPSDLAWGFVRMFDAHAYLSGFELGLFRTDDEAADYLELDRDVVAALRERLTFATSGVEEAAMPTERVRTPVGSSERIETGDALDEA